MRVLLQSSTAILYECRQAPSLRTSPAYHLPDGGVKEVEHEQDDVNDEDDGVQTASKAEAAFAEAVHVVPRIVQLRYATRPCF